jgi:PHP family Zn ribbon phosphoesterase
VDLLADRKEGARPAGARPFKSIIPLQEIISEVLGMGVNTKAVKGIYMRLLEHLGSEFSILLERPLADIERVGPPRLGEAVALMREGRVNMAPGYDGQLVKIRIFGDIERDGAKGQTLMF